MGRLIYRGEASIQAHNDKWNRRYRARARIRNKYPDEFRALLAHNTYPVALRLIEEAHPDELVIEEPAPPPPPREPKPGLTCSRCGGPLRDHSLGECRL